MNDSAYAVLYNRQMNTKLFSSVISAGLIVSQ